MSNNQTSTQRWFNYFLRSGNGFHLFWQEYLQGNQRDILFVLGLGFDPRMCLAYEALLEAKGSGKRDLLLIRFQEGPNSPSQKYSHLVEANLKKLNDLAPKGCKKTEKVIPMWSKDGRRIGSRNAASVFPDLSDFHVYTDIVIDVSAMPRGIYFPLIGKALYLMDTYGKKKAMHSGSILNLHVLVSENAPLDSKIKDEGIDEDANYMHGFTGTLETESDASLPRIWIPILGENQEEQLERILNKVSADEICPVIPMPSVKPRRGDSLLVEYRELLFDRLRVEPGNFIYVSEQNPFEVYREIHRTVYHYKEALKNLGGCQVVISATSSKLLSIGALLAAYELKNEGVGVINVETQGYRIENDITTELHNTTLSTLWLAGDCYAR